jgi:phenolic acid decarboxylase
MYAVQPLKGLKKIVIFNLYFPKSVHPEPEASFSYCINDNDICNESRESTLISSVVPLPSAEFQLAYFMRECILEEIAAKY